MIRIIISGSRVYNDTEKMFGILDKYLLTHHAPSDIIIVHGAANGADWLAGDWARQRGTHADIFPADWRKHDKAAGPIRNQQMLDAGCDGVIAFPLSGSIGTYDMIERAKKAGKWVREIPHE